MGRIDELDGLTPAEPVKKGDVTPLDLIEVAITTIEKLYPNVNAAIHILKILVVKPRSISIPRRRSPAVRLGNWRRLGEGHQAQLVRLPEGCRI